MVLWSTHWLYDRRDFREGLKKNSQKQKALANTEKKFCGLLSSSFKKNDDPKI